MYTYYLLPKKYLQVNVFYSSHLLYNNHLMTLSKTLKITQIMGMVYDSSSSPTGCLPDVWVCACICVPCEWFIGSHSFETNVNMKQEKKDAIPQSKSMQVLFWGALAIVLFIISTLSILPSIICASLSYLFSIKYKFNNFPIRYSNIAASLGPNSKVTGLSLFHDVFLRHIRGNRGINYEVPRERKQGKLENFGRRGIIQMLGEWQQ